MKKRSDGCDASTTRSAKRCARSGCRVGLIASIIEYGAGWSLMSRPTIVSGKWFVEPRLGFSSEEHEGEAAMTDVDPATADASINHDSPSTRLIAGINVSDTPLITAGIRDGQR